MNRPLRLGVGAAIIGLGLTAAYVAAQPAPKAKVIKVSAKRFDYSPGHLTLKKGQRVVLELTSRDVVISTTLTARVSAVLPNGAMLVEATKDVEVNSERQTITVRGIVRPADVAADNTVRSDRLGQLEVRVNGKGVVGDAIRRPFFLYRLLLGLLPF